MKKKVASVVVGVGMSGAFLALALRSVHLDELGGILAKTRWPWILPAALMCLVDLAIRAARWRLLLAQSPGRVRLLFRLEAIGLAVNNVLFLRLGELARAVLAARELKLSVAATLSSVVIERVMDMTALLTLFNLSAFFLPELVPAGIRAAAAGALLALIGALFLLAVAEGYWEARGRLERLLRRWPRVHELVSQLVLGGKALRRPKAALGIAALSLGLWLGNAFIFWAVAFACGLEHLLNYPRCLFLLSWSGAGAALPATPGGFGTVEAVIKQAMVSLGASSSEAFGYALLCHMVGYVIVTMLGLFFLYKVGLSLGGLKEALRR